MQDKAATLGEASAKGGGALSAVMRGRWLLAAAATALFVGWPLLYAPPFLLYIATLVLLASIGATSLHLVIRSGHVSLGQAAFMGIAGYASVLLVMRAGWPFHFAFLASVALAGLAGLAIGPVLLRMTGKYFVLVTFLFGEMVRLVFIEWVSLTGGSNGIFEIPPPYPLFKSPLAYYYLALAAAAVCIGICARILGSEIGRTIELLARGRAARRLLGRSGAALQGDDLRRRLRPHRGRGQPAVALLAFHLAALLRHLQFARFRHHERDRRHE